MTARTPDGYWRDLHHVDVLVERAIYNYPSLFANRTQVLHHLLIVIGNGYKWSGGVLVNAHPVELDRTDEEVQWTYRDLYADLAALGEETDVSAEMHEFLARQRAEHDAMNAEFLRRRRTAATLAQTPGPLAGTVYPPHPEYANAFAYPDTIAADWDAARREILAVVEPLWYAGNHLREPLERITARPAPTIPSPEALTTLRAAQSTALDAQAI